MKYLPIIIIVLVLILFFFLIKNSLNNVATKIRLAFLGRREDDNNTLHYFKHTDYENMIQETFTFVSNDLELQGYLYQVTPLKHKGVVIFVHGMGVGHIQYTNDIHHYCEKGYDVYTFDGQGCYNSKGDGLFYFSNYIKNLDDFITYLKTKEELQNTKFILVGHSLGGYAVNIISKIHQNDIKKIVSMSSFINPKQLINDKLKNALPKFSNIIAKNYYKQEKNHFKNYDLDTLSAMKNNNIDILFIHGDIDQVVNIETTYNVLKNQFKDKDNMYFMLVKGRNHNPYVIKESASYYKETSHKLEEINTNYKDEELKEKLKEYYESLDYNLLVKLDDKVMNVIDNFIDDKEISKESIID